MPIMDDEWIKAFGELSLADRELCRRDIILYGGALIRRDENGKAHRIPAEGGGLDLGLFEEPQAKSIFERPWWESG